MRLVPATTPCPPISTAKSPRHRPVWPDTVCEVRTGLTPDGNALITNGGVTIATRTEDFHDVLEFELDEDDMTRLEEGSRLRIVIKQCGQILRPMAVQIT